MKKKFNFKKGVEEGGGEKTQHRARKIKNKLKEIL